jgi:hypothetical protein
MKPYAMIYDNFLESYGYFRDFCDTAVFKDEVNPYDGFTYPDVCLRAPFEVIQQAMYRAVGHCNLIHGALRLSRHGKDQPYKVHSDELFGASFTLLVYLNRPEHCKGGTAFVRHSSGAVRGTDNDLWRADESNPSAFETVFMSPMVSNRAIIFDSGLLHRAEPSEGFGTDNHDGRMVFVGAFH